MRNRSTTIKITGSTAGFALGDLAYLVNMAREADIHDESLVYIAYYAGSNYEEGSASLSITIGED